MEPSAGVPSPTGNNQHFQMPLNSWLSEAEELLVPPQHHRLCKQRLCLFLCQGFWMSLELQCPAAPVMDAWERGCPGGQKLRTVIQVMSRIMVQVLRDHPTNSESSAPAQGVNQGLRRFGMGRSTASHHSRPWRLSNASKAAIFRAGAARYFYKYINLFKEKQI